MRTKTGAFLAAAAMLLPACGSANQDAIEAVGLRCPEGSDCFDEVKPPGDGSEITVQSGDLFFEYEGTRSSADDVQALTIRILEGDLTLTLENIGAAIHNFRVDEALAKTAAGKKVEAAGGQTETGVLPLFAGQYTFYCDIPGHKAAGMQGTLLVLSEADADQLDEQDGDAEVEESPEDEASPEASPSEEASPATEG